MRTFFALCLGLSICLIPITVSAQNKKTDKKDVKKTDAKKTDKKDVKKAPKKKDPGFKADFKNKTIRFKGYVCINRGVLEVLICLTKGKRHESIVATKLDAEKLHLALIIMGLKPKPQVKKFGDGGTLTGDKVYIYLQFKDPKTKKLVRYRSEDLIYNIRTKKTMIRCGWVFTGSKHIKHRFPYLDKNGKVQHQTKRIYMANYSGNLVTTFHDPNAILDNPLATGGDDTVYYANYMALPARGAYVEVIMTLKPNAAWDKASLDRVTAQIKAATAGQKSNAPKKNNSSKPVQKGANKK